MARLRNRHHRPLLPRRAWTIAALAIIVLLTLAWFDGGEEPIHPITREIPLPELR